MNNETCGAHLRNLMVPYKNLIALIDALNTDRISHLAFIRATEEMKKDFDRMMEFSESDVMENTMWRNE